MSLAEVYCNICGKKFNIKFEHISEVYEKMTHCGSDNVAIQGFQWDSEAQEIMDQPIKSRGGCRQKYSRCK